MFNVPVYLQKTFFHLQINITVLKYSLKVHKHIQGPVKRPPSFNKAITRKQINTEEKKFY